MATIEADPYEKGRRGMRKLLRGFLRMVWGGDDVLLSGYYGYGSLGDEALHCGSGSRDVESAYWREEAVFVDRIWMFAG